MATTLEIPTITARSAGIAMTPAEFDAIDESEAGYLYELIRGILVVAPIPSEQEASPNELLGGLLFVYKEQDPAGSALDLTLPERYILLPDGRRRADRVIWAGLGRRPDPKRDVPTIAVEFVSPGKRDWFRDDVTKKQEYLDLGVVEYWIIDRFRRTMTIHRNLATGPIEIVIVEGETYQTPLLPGFELPLSRLLGASDAWLDPS